MSHPTLSSPHPASSPLPAPLPNPHTPQPPSTSLTSHLPVSAYLSSNLSVVRSVLSHVSSTSAPLPPLLLRSLRRRNRSHSKPASASRRGAKAKKPLPADWATNPASFSSLPRHVRRSLAHSRSGADPLRPYFAKRFLSLPNPSRLPLLSNSNSPPSSVTAKPLLQSLAPFFPLHLPSVPLTALLPILQSPPPSAPGESVDAVLYAPNAFPSSPLSFAVVLCTSPSLYNVYLPHDHPPATTAALFPSSPAPLPTPVTLRTFSPPQTFPSTPAGFRSLVSKHRALALRDAARVHDLLGLPVYPRDYPDLEAGRLYWEGGGVWGVVRDACAGGGRAPGSVLKGVRDLEKGRSGGRAGAVDWGNATVVRGKMAEPFRAMCGMAVDVAGGNRAKVVRRNCVPTKTEGKKLALESGRDGFLAARERDGGEFYMRARVRVVGRGRVEEGEEIELLRSRAAGGGGLATGKVVCGYEGEQGEGGAVGYMLLDLGVYVEGVQGWRRVTWGGDVWCEGEVSGGGVKVLVKLI